jgi:hypothetical protein
VQCEGSPGVGQFPSHWILTTSTRSSGGYTSNGDQSLVARPEVQGTQRRGRVAGLVGASLVLKRIDDDDGVHERHEGYPRWRAERGEFVLRCVVEFPLVHRSDAVPGADLLPRHPLLGRGWSVGAVAIEAGEEPLLGCGVAPGFGLEPPAPHGL